MITQHKPTLKEKKLKNQEDKLNEINRKKIKNKSITHSILHYKYISTFVNQSYLIFSLSYDNIYLNTIKNKFPSF
jgi:hypothetical protein